MGSGLPVFQPDADGLGETSRKECFSGFSAEVAIGRQGLEHDGQKSLFWPPLIPIGVTQSAQNDSSQAVHLTTAATPG